MTEAVQGLISGEQALFGEGFGEGRVELDGVDWEAPAFPASQPMDVGIEAAEGGDFAGTRDRPAEGPEPSPDHRRLYTQPGFYGRSGVPGIVGPAEISPSP